MNKDFWHIIYQLKQVKYNINELLYINYWNKGTYRTNEGTTTIMFTGHLSKIRWNINIFNKNNCNEIYIQLKIFAMSPLICHSTTNNIVCIFAHTNVIVLHD